MIRRIGGRCPPASVCLRVPVGSVRDAAPDGGAFELAAGAPACDTTRTHPDAEEPDGPADSGAPDDTGPADTASEQDNGESDTEAKPRQEEGCGCGTGGGTTAPVALLVLAAVMLGRRRP